MAGVFEELLATFADDADRKAFEDLGNKNPKIKDSFLMRSDYSRKMDEVKSQLEELDGWKKWRDEHWDNDKRMTRREVEKIEALERLQAEKQQLEEQLAAGLGQGGADVTFEQLNQWGETFAKTKGMVTKSDMDKVIADKEKEIQNLIKTQSQFETYASLTVPELNLRHLKEFGEPFKSKDFIKEATEKGRFDLEDYYENAYVQGKRSEKLKTDHEAELQRVTAEADAKVKAAEEAAAATAVRAAAMGPNGLVPTDNEGTQMGSFQRKYLKVDDKVEEGKAPEVPLGEGGIAAFAAKKFLENQANRHA